MIHSDIGCNQYHHHAIDTPASLAMRSGLPSLAVARRHSPRPAACHGHSVALTAASLAAAITCRGQLSLAAARATSPAITRRGPSFISHSPRLAAAPSESSTEARSPSYSPPVGVRITRRGRPSVAAAHRRGPPLLAAARRHSPRPAV